MLVLLSGAYANSIVVYNPETGTYYTCYPKNTTNGKTIYILNVSSATRDDNITIIHKIVIENQTAVMVRAYNALIAELERNISKLQKELDKKNKLLAEYISYKKKNVELQKNITQLQKQITTLKAENELIKQQNEVYKSIITDLINKQSNETKEEYIMAYNEWKKDVSNFKTSVIIGGLVCLIIGVLLIKFKKRYDYPV
ncbi:hypothetical protein [Methanotorris igneus]|nr:hypothetical protein [Methanotorris igneus]